MGASEIDGLSLCLVMAQIFTIDLIEEKGVGPVGFDVCKYLKMTLYSQLTP